MNRKQRKRLAMKIECSANYGGTLAVVSFFAQIRPWTTVAITYFTSLGLEDTIIGYGFTKANWPDKWSPTYGRNLAVSKAAAHIVRQVEERVGTLFDLDLLNTAEITEATEQEEQGEVIVGEDWVGPVRGLLDVEHGMPIYYII